MASEIYAYQKAVLERHRHRYEVNPKLLNTIKNNGLIFSGYDERKERMEIIEIPSNTFFMGTQYHPEFKSRPLKPSPVFLAFVGSFLPRHNSAKKLIEQVTEHGV
jgi:CTP synthase